jgi:multidrug resistance efflux pump
MKAGGWSSDEARGYQQKKTMRSGHSWGRRLLWGASVTAIDQMARVYRWACSEKRRTLEDLLRLAERLRADIGRLTGPSAMTTGDGGGQSADERRERLVRSIAGLETTIERAREEVAVAEAELARVEQMKQGRETADKTSTQRRNERAAGLGRQR